MTGLLHLEICGGGFAGAAVGFNLEADLLAIVKAGQASTFDRRDMHENVGSALVGLDEAITLLTVEPLHYTCRHDEPLLTP